MDVRHIPSPQEERLLIATILSGMLVRVSYEHELTTDERDVLVSNAQLLAFDVIDQSLRHPYPPDENTLKAAP